MPPKNFLQNQISHETWKSINLKIIFFYYYIVQEMSSHKLFQIKNYTIERFDDLVNLCYKNEIGIDKVYKFYKIETKTHKFMVRLHNDDAKSNLQTSFLFTEKEKHIKMIYFIDSSF